MREGYGVIVTKNGEPILTIDSSMLSGQPEFSDEEADAIRDASEHLAAFIGPPREPCSVCGHMGPCTPDCPCKDIPF